ncbi:MAG: hypothetical protein ACJAYV_002485 [Oleispira sp.]|jgi:hypothetical protein
MVFRNSSLLTVAPAAPATIKPSKTVLATSVEISAIVMAAPE